MLPQNTDEEFYEFRKNDLFVDDSAKAVYSDAVMQVFARQKAFRMHPDLMWQDAVKEEDVQDTSPKENVKEEDAQDAVKEKDNQHALPLEDVEEDPSPKDDVKDDPLKVVDSDVQNTLLKENVEQDDVEGWRLVVNKKKKPIPFNDLVMQVLNAVNGLTVTVGGLTIKVDEVTTDVDEVRTKVDEVKTEVKALKDDIKETHKAILNNGESIVMLTLGAYLSKLGKQKNQEVCIPIYGKVLPYAPFAPLEQMTSFCLKSGNKVRSTPSNAKIDFLVKMVDKSTTDQCFSPRSSVQQVLCTFSVSRVSS
ncbi:hypothetical protein GOP47_0025017 [Adiantum capillus-veneris]|uniref:Uncharacterized protein n=1 Tax=Adiantum capillus-veneris TaxID=13818 RepID=A0A9D4U3W3_ADICA|nr:hypothetical protein GOP47_0025017 [Adiantum capillus-veneris]